MSEEGQVLTVSSDVVPAVPESEPVERDEQGRFVKQDEAPEPEVAVDEPTQDTAGDEQELLRARVESAELTEKAARLGLLGQLDENLPADQWVHLRNLQEQHGVKNLSQETQEKLASSSQTANRTEARPDHPASSSDNDQQVLDAYRERAQNFAASNPDYNDVLSRIELNDNIAPAVQVALVQHENGPELAYYLGQNPDVANQLNSMSATRAVAELGRIAGDLAQRNQTYDAWMAEHLGVEIPPSVMSEYQRKADKLPALSEEERGIAAAVYPAAHVSRTIIAMGRPDIAVHLVREPALVGRLNSMHPMAAAGELARIARELASEGANSKIDGPGPSPIRPIKKTAPTATGLADDLPMDQWMKRREAEARRK